MIPRREFRTQAVLSPDEQLVWSGDPATGIRFEWAYLLFGLIAIVFVGAGIRTLYIADDTMGRVFGFLFAGGGAFYLIDLMFLGRRRRESTCYVLTNRSAIWLTNDTFEVKLSIPIASLSDCTVKVSRNGEGSIVCNSTASNWPHTDEDGRAVRGSLFQYVNDPYHVHDLLSHQQREISASTERGFWAVGIEFRPLISHEPARPGIGKRHVPSL